MLRLCLCAMFLVPAFLCAQGAGPQMRDTVYGKVEGVDDSARTGTCFWKGVPFARPPVGALRWRPPVEPDPWAGPRPARAFANASAQFGTVYGPGLNNGYDATIASSLNRAVGSEDCLYLNIWRPASAVAGLPVIFFLHGGSNVCGYTADPVYDGAALARSANVVVVTANYRLGVFGWLDLPPLQDSQGGSGNFGTLDQIQALKFIARNIASFGGNPGNVTLMGQSAGAVDVCTLLSSPAVVNAAPQLVHRAIIMSGGAALDEELPSGCIPTLQTAGYFRRQGQALRNALLIADGLAADDSAADAYAEDHAGPPLAAYLRSKTPAEIFRQVLVRLAPARLAWTTPIPDGKVVADSPLSAIKAGRHLKVPLLVSGTRDEARLFSGWLALSPLLGGAPGLIVDEAARFRLLMAFDPDGAPALDEQQLIHKAYLPADRKGTGYKARLDRLNAMFFIPNREVLLQALARKQTDIWCCQFSWDQEPAPWNTVYGACHLFDLPFAFGNFGPSLFSNAICGTANKGGRLALSAAMMAALGAFARNGDPNDPALGVTWPVWPRTLILDASLTERKLSVR